jgi:uncharacterized protein (DUF2132 family)
MKPIEHKDPLHGVTLKMMLEALVVWVGWKKMSEIIKIRCFMFDPTITSSLKFLRRTPWARKKVEDLYLSELKHHQLAEKETPCYKPRTKA